MKVCMVSSEAVPFLKTGGLADVVSSLSRALAAGGEDVRIVLPRFSLVSTSDLEKTGTLIVPMGLGEEKCTVYKTVFPDGEVPVYFIDNPVFSERTGLYGKSGSHTYRDNHFRFALFSRAVLGLCSELSWIPDIIHSHDWQSAPVNGYLRELRISSEYKLFDRTKTVFTIHNIGYQGVFSKHDIHSTGLEWSTCAAEAPSYGEGLNFLKTGILNADVVTTVSPTYAEEIRTPKFGDGMENLLESRKESVYGILNGADYYEWDPAQDSFIPATYSTGDMSGKKECKKALQEEMGLPIREDIPLIGIVGRLVEQKGFYELCDPRRGSLWRICSEMSVQVVVLGTGEDWIEKELVETAGKLSNLKVFITFSNRLAHLIEAGSDLFLMPSRYEPCGLNQIYSLRYGTLPIVRRTGGLADTVDNYNPHTGEGTGFVFDDLSPESIYGTTEWAVSTWFERPEHFAAMQRRAMEKHFSWEDSSESYRELYTSLLT
ncbi:MAG: glycogen synthase [Spirochaetaceae bacterium]